MGKVPLEQNYRVSSDWRGPLERVHNCTGHVPWFDGHARMSDYLD